MHYQKICFDAMEVVKEAAAYVSGRHVNRENLNIREKGRQDFVTSVDKEAEHILVSGLSKLLPEAGFVAEEGTSVKRGKNYNWIIDPLDGTTNFIHGVFPFAISVGLAESNDVVVGIVYEFGLNEYFYAWKDGGAFLNGNPIQVSYAASIGQSLIATGFPYTDFTCLAEFMNSMAYFMENSHGLRRMGSAATDIAYVACGRYDGFYEYGLKPWDIAAGILLVREAGGEVSDFRGDAHPLFSKDFFCTNRNTFTEFKEALQKIMIPQ